MKLPSLHQKRRLIYSVLFLLLLFFCFLLYSRENLCFDHFCRKIFCQDLQCNTINLHYTLDQPWKYGVFQEEPVLPVYTPNSNENASRLLDARLDYLESVSPERLSDSNQYIYHLLSRKLALQKAKNQYAYFDEPLSPSSGMHQNLPILLSEYRFESKKDVENYLSLLSQMDSYFSGLLQYEKEKAAAGLFMSKNSSYTVAKQCQSFLSEESIRNSSHFLVTSFEERLSQLQERKSGSLTSEETIAYGEKNKEILLSEVLPVYLSLSEEMNALAGSKWSPAEARGLAHFPDGREYYCLLIKDVTGSYRETDQIGELLFDRFQSLVTELKLSGQKESIPKESLNESKEVPLEKLSAAEMLELLEKCIEEDFPSLPISNSLLPASKRMDSSLHCSIKSISSTLADKAAPAFYLTPPIDEYRQHVIYINPTSGMNGISLFTTLAHEGFPGHLYQTVYAQKSGLYPVRNPIRSILNYEGYAEGWAYFVELKSYDYASMYSGASYFEEKMSRELSLCLCALMDFYIHYYDLSCSQCNSFLASLGLSNPQADQLYQYIAEEPAVYLKYYLSYLEILNLQDQARLLWQDQYTDFVFYKFYLDAGPSDFIALQSLME